MFPVVNSAAWQLAKYKFPGGSTNNYDNDNGDDDNNDNEADEVDDDDDDGDVDDDDDDDDGGGGGGKAAKPLVWGQLGSPHLQRALIYWPDPPTSQRRSINFVSYISKKKYRLCIFYLFDFIDQTHPQGKEEVSILYFISLWFYCPDPPTSQGKESYVFAEFVGMHLSGVYIFVCFMMTLLGSIFGIICIICWCIYLCPMVGLWVVLH